ncbi:hypothetical protein BC835DRAFT_1310039 [Cytidiella melzeri]|nr:hypothetical protein BC835DRAFT_1310039 [Cytidiella melzeri]
MYSWNTTIEDTSPILDFHPYSDGAANGGWAPFFEGIGFWQGTAIYLYGTQNCTYNVTLDSQPVTIPFESSLPDGVLFWQDGLSPTTHSLSLTAIPAENTTQQLSFDKAVFTNIGINASNQNSTAVHYTGQWSNESFYNVPSDTAPAPYMETSNPGDTVSLTFTGGVAVAVNGARDWGHWTYNVTLDGVASSVHNASTWWLMGDTVLFYQSNLDPQETHTIEMANMGTPNDKLSLNYFTVFMPNKTSLDTSPSASSSTTLVPSQTSSQSPSPQSSSSQLRSTTNLGVIIGPIVACVIVIAIAAFFWLRTRRRYVRPTVDLLAPATSIAPFPRNERPDIWAKGMEAGEMSIQAIPPVAPHQGKRQLPASRSESQPSLAIPVSSVPHVASPTPAIVAVSSPPPSSTGRTASTQPVSVDHLIELIAQRIDPGGRAATLQDPNVPPPQYAG